MAKRKSENKPNQLKERSHLGRLCFTPRSVARGLETLEAYSMRKVNEEAIRRSAKQKKWERFQADCEQCKKYFSKKKKRSYWLKRLEKAASLPVQYWGDSRIEWPKDKAIVYATMAICMQKYSHFKIIPDSFKKTSQYEANKYVDGAFEIFDNFSSTEFLSYIETDLENEGLLPSKFETNAQDKKSKKHENQIEGEWSHPMTKARMMKALRIEGYRAFNHFANRYGIRQEGSRQLYQIRLDKMDKSTQAKLEKA